MVSTHSSHQQPVAYEHHTHRIAQASGVNVHLLAFGIHSQDRGPLLLDLDTGVARRSYGHIHKPIWAHQHGPGEMPATLLGGLAEIGKAGDLLRRAAGCRVTILPWITHQLIGEGHIQPGPRWRGGGGRLVEEGHTVGIAEVA